MTYKIDVITNCTKCSNFRWCAEYGNPEKWCLKLQQSIEYPLKIPPECSLEEWDINQKINEIYECMDKLERTEKNVIPMEKHGRIRILSRLASMYENYFEAEKSEKEKLLQRYEGAKEIASFWITEEEIKDIEEEVKSCKDPIEA